MGLEEAERRAQHIRDVVTERVRLGREVVSRSVSIGVAAGRPGKATTSSLLSQADQAVMVAKTKGGNAISVFTDEMQEESEKRNMIELSLRAAIADESLFLEYQPEVDLSTAGSSGWRPWCGGIIRCSGCCSQGRSSTSPRRRMWRANSDAG